MYRINSKVNGFTLIEVLLVIGILSILAAVTVVAINPSRQLAKARDSQRVADVYTLLNSIHQYALDHEDNFPEDLTTEMREVCRTSNDMCGDLLDLSPLTYNQSYLVDVPIDPLCTDVVNEHCAAGGTGYFVKINENGRVEVSTNNTERQEPVLVVR